jgi:hypothetical protein
MAKYLYFSMEQAKKCGCSIYIVEETGEEHYASQIDSSNNMISSFSDMKFIGTAGDFIRKVESGHIRDEVHLQSSAGRMMVCMSLAHNDKPAKLDSKLLNLYYNE